MTQEEFFERTKLTVSEEEFNTIHEVYMLWGEGVTKDMFCHSWKKYSDFDRKVMMRMAEQHAQMESEVHRLEDELVAVSQAHREETNKRFEQLVEISITHQSVDLRNMAAAIKSMKDVVTYKILHGYSLWDEERDYALTLINK